MEYTGYSKAANLASLSSWLHNMSQKVVECGLCRLLFTSFNVTASLFLALRVVNERRLVQVGQRVCGLSAVHLSQCEPQGDVAASEGIYV